MKEAAKVHFPILCREKHDTPKLYQASIKRKV